MQLHLLSALLCLVFAVASQASQGIDTFVNDVQARGTSQNDVPGWVRGLDIQPRMVRRHQPSSKRKCKAKAKKTTLSKSKSQPHGSKGNDDSHQNSKHSESPKKHQGQHSGGGHPSVSDVVSKGKGLIGQTFKGPCHDSGATDDSPNGSIDFLNCGISKSDPSGGKWSPPEVKMSQLKFSSSKDAAKSQAFKPCAKYSAHFEQASRNTDVPVALLMSFAMQESTCNPNIDGGNGEIGMMQLTPDKCKHADCYDVEQNIEIGAKYFKSQLDKFDGNVIEALGAYNGWFRGMTYNEATSKKYGCHAQRNLDYHFQMLNGWILGKEGYKLTKYNNLASC